MKFRRVNTENGAREGRERFSCERDEKGQSPARPYLTLPYLTSDPYLTLPYLNSDPYLPVFVGTRTVHIPYISFLLSRGCFKSGT